MTKLLKTTALALAASSVALTAVPAEARPHHRSSYSEDYGSYRYNNDGYGYNGRQAYQNSRVWQGRDGTYYCRKKDGTTGLIVGGAAGALLGQKVEQGSGSNRCR